MVDEANPTGPEVCGLDAELAAMARRIGPLLHDMVRQRAELAHSEQELMTLAQNIDAAMRVEQEWARRDHEVDQAVAQYARSVRVPDYVSPAHLAEDPYDPGDHMGKL